jgi:hypothetical protein
MPGELALRTDWGRSWMGSCQVGMVKRKSVIPSGIEPHFYYQVRDETSLITGANKVHVRKRVQ